VWQHVSRIMLFERSEKHEQPFALGDKMKPKALEADPKKQQRRSI
jgi:hypothetical protein